VRARVQQQGSRNGRALRVRDIPLVPALHQEDAGREDAMNRAMTFAAGAALTWIAWRSRPGLLRVPIAMVGMGLLANAVRGTAVEGAWPDQHEMVESAPGTELPAWW
jgi:hypothetical protein